MPRNKNEESKKTLSQTHGIIGQVRDFYECSGLVKALWSYSLGYLTTSFACQYSFQVMNDYDKIINWCFC